MLNSVSTITTSTTTPTIRSGSKGSHMENRIDKIDVMHDHEMLVALFYRIELMKLVQALLYEHT